jgi:uncharacterized membrane protein (UPF0182 family)
VAGALAFVRPEYRVAAESAPVLLRTAAATSRGVAFGRTPSEALALASGNVAAGAAQVQVPSGDALTRARQAYRESRDALRRGDWGAFGRALDAVGAALEGRPGVTQPRGAP